MGRPSKLTPVTQRRICDLIRKGVPRERAARLAGIGTTTFHRWMQLGGMSDDAVSAELPGESSARYREFRERVCNAEDDLVERAIATATDLLDARKCREPAIRLNAAKFILSHRFPAEFSTRQEVRNTGADGGPIQVEGRMDVTVRPLVSNEQLAAMSPEQLAATIGGLAGGNREPEPA